MTGVEVFAMPQSKVAYATADSNGREEDEDDEPIASINAMTIRVGNDDEIEGDEKTFSRPSKTIESGKTIVSPSISSPPSSLSSSNGKMSSLRSLLGVPPTSNSVPRALQGKEHSSGNSSAGSGSTLGVPPSTSSLTAPAGIGGASGAIVGGGRTNSSKGTEIQTLPSEIAPSRRKVILGPGCSALDWARMKSSIPSRGFRKITASELKLHKSKDDAWSVFNGKVYDMTPYMRFHPGGADELMRVAGRDGTRLFMLTHSWVNIDSMIDSEGANLQSKVVRSSQNTQMS
ncbi:hypothetical protein CBS101457_004332 [Exobasidium rhododendri]|nr:hypothetical protein CBS101457_004332 [Exobasidium rhododendri]